MEGDRPVVSLKQSKLATATVATVLILCIISQIGLAAAAAGYQDEFTAASLQSFWTFTNPAGTGSYSLTAHSGYLRITAPINARLSTTNTNAPRVMQSITGDFVATTYVTGSFTDELRGGLLVWQDSNNFMRIEKYGTDKVLMYGIIGGAQQSPTTVTLSSGSNNLYLKYQRVGSTLTGYYSTDGSTWTAYTGSYTFSGAIQIGLFVIDTSTTTSLSADFDYFHITPYSTLSVLPEYPVGVFGAAAAIAGAYLFFKAKDRVKPALHL